MSASLIRIFRDHAQKNADIKPKLYRMVAERLRTRVLDEDEAEVIAEWFDRLAAGEPAKEVFPRKPAGRPKGTTPRKLDDIDIAWLVRRAIEADIKPTAAYRLVADAHGLDWQSVRNLYSKLRGELG